MPRRTLPTVSLALLLASCSLWTSATEPPVVAPSSAATSASVPPSVRVYLPISGITDASHTPRVAWDPDGGRTDASMRHLLVGYLDAAKKQDLSALRNQYLTPEAGAALVGCMNDRVDIDVAWAECVLARDASAVVEGTSTTDDTHGTITYRTQLRGQNAPGPARTIPVLLTREGPLLEASNLNAP